EEVSASAGATFQLEEVSRGGAFGDIDNDGDIDVLFVNSNGPARLLINQDDPDGWTGVRLTFRSTGRGLPASRVLTAVEGPSGLRRLLRLDPGGGYASASDPRVVLAQGTPAASSAVWIELPGRGPMRLVGLPDGCHSTVFSGR
ncbi:MAG: hypothetical protein OES47_01235, partial [Acidobacteriota bacterium]|nr:hypothetical protein [Acidobacteriota bacterium]